METVKGLEEQVESEHNDYIQDPILIRIQIILGHFFSSHPLLFIAQATFILSYS